jgi:hypothetical protein
MQNGETTNMLTDEMKRDIDKLLDVVTDNAAISKLLQRKYDAKVSVREVRNYRAEMAAVEQLEPQTQEEVEIIAEEINSQAPSRMTMSIEEGSAKLLAALCRWAFKHGKLLPNLTLDQQRERARADGYDGPIEGWA